MIFKPTVDRVLIKSDDAEDVSAGGIYIPPIGQETPSKGTIMAIGPKVEDIVLGDYVVYGKYAGTVVQIDGEEFVILEEENVLGVLK